MADTLKIPSYHELVELTDSELKERIKLALNLLDRAEKLGGNAFSEERVYWIYKNELSKRDFKRINRLK